VILWKGYDNPPDLFGAATESIECDAGLMGAGSDLAAFVDWLDLVEGQSLTVVAHSFGSVVTGTALADHGLRCTDVVVAGSPGMTVDELRQLHVEASHFFSEEAPGDTVAELGIFGAAPTSSRFGGTRMRTNAPGHDKVLAHSHYFEPGSEALANTVAVVTGRYADVHPHVWSVPEVAGGLVCWTLRLPTMPVRVVGRRYRGPGFRLMINAMRLCDLGAAQTGNLVREALDEGERALAWVVRQAGGSWRPFSSPDGG
jgi:pimeloyl-ACP methyl ester carboxylesterase